MISEDVRNKVENIVAKNKVRADYLDVRLVKSSGTLISFRKKKIEDVSLPRDFNGIVRAVTKGGWGYANFNDIDELSQVIKKVVGYSKKVGKGKTKLARAKKIKDKVIASEKAKEFVKVSLEDKLKITKKYNDLVWKTDKNLSSSSLYYTDSLVSKLFVSSDGSAICQEKPYVYSILSVVAKSGDVIQKYSTHLADNNYNDLKKKENKVIEAIDIVNKLTKAEIARSGVYTVILDPRIAGVFAHEAFGHLSEADNVYENEQLARVMKLGKRFGSSLITIIDDPTISGLRGSYIYDDEGVRGRKTVLLNKGTLNSRLHMRETAGKLGEENNGHARASGAVRPQVRMGVTYIKAGKSSFKNMLKGIRKGLYCISWQGGNTDHENFTFTAGYGIEVREGKLGRIVRDVKLVGNLFETLKNVDMVGNDLKYEGGTCGKGGQYLPETSGAPHIRIRNVMVIGV